MKKYMRTIISNPLVSGSTVVLIGTFLANFLSYLFTIGMANLLSNSDFGIIASLIAVINILSILASTIMTVFTKFSASYIGQNKKYLISTLFTQGNNWVGIISLLITLIIMIFSYQIAAFLHINNIVLVYLVALTLFFTFLTSVGQGILMGLLEFVPNSLINIVSALAKLVLAVSLVYLGLNVFGAIFAIFLANMIGYVVVFIIMKRYLKKTQRDTQESIPNLQHQLVQYGFPVFLSSLGITAFISLDIILVKHFFSEDLVGQYAKLSLMGRSIFYLVVPIASVAFPLFAQKKERKERLFGTLLLSMFLVGVPLFIISIIYFLFPTLIIYIFTPAQPALNLAPYLGLFSVFIILFSFSYLLNNFYLSIGKTRVFFLTMIGSFLEVIYIVFFHQNLYQIIVGLIGVSFLLLVSLLLYYPIAIKH